MTYLVDENLPLTGFGSSFILPGQQLATVAAYQLPELSELSQQEVFTNEMGHPVEGLVREEGHRRLCREINARESEVCSSHGSVLLFWKASKILHRNSEIEVGRETERNQRGDGWDGRKAIFSRRVGEQVNGEAQKGAVLGQLCHVDWLNQRCGR